MLRAFRVLSTFLFILAIPVALLTTNIRFMANEPRVYRYAIDEFDAVATSGIARDELLRAGAELRAYFNNGQDEVSIRVQEDGQDTNLFSSRETVHLKDVKSRFNLVNRLQEFSIIYLAVYIAAVVLWSREVSPRGFAVNVAIGSGITLAVIGGVGAFGALGFDSAWEDFHKTIFSNDFWRLNPTADHLIQMFPLAFWESIVFFIGLLVAAQAALLLIASLIYLGISGRHQAARRLEAYYAVPAQ